MAKAAYMLVVGV